MKWLKHLLWKTVTQDPLYPEVNVSCPEMTVEEIDQALYDKLLEEVKAADGVFDGSKLTILGCTFDFQYDAATGTLHYTCLKKPELVGCGYISSKISKLIDKAKGATI